MAALQLCLQKYFGSWHPIAAARNPLRSGETPGRFTHRRARLLDTAKETGTPNMVSVNRRFMPFLNCALEWVKPVGPLRYVRGTMTRHARSEPEFVWTTAVHAVDTLRYIAGEVSQASLRTMKARGAADWYAIDLRFESGIYGRIDVLPTTGCAKKRTNYWRRFSRDRDLSVWPQTRCALFPRQPGCARRSTSREHAAKMC